VTLNDENNHIDVMIRRTKTGAALVIDAYAILRSLSYQRESDVFAPTRNISARWRFPNFRNGEVDLIDHFK
jgi:hypothetical protein